MKKIKISRIIDVYTKYKKMRKAIDIIESGVDIKGDLLDDIYWSCEQGLKFVDDALESDIFSWFVYDADFWCDSYMFDDYVLDSPSLIDFIKFLKKVPQLKSKIEWDMKIKQIKIMKFEIGNK